MNTDFGRIAVYRVQASDRAAFIKSVTAYVTVALQASDNIMAEGYWERDQENTIWLIERWTGQEAWRNFQLTPDATELEGLAHIAAQMPVEESLINDLEPLSKAAWLKKANPDDHPFTIVLMLNANPGTEEEFKKIYHEAMPQFRGEPGVITYQLSQSKSDETKFITYEKFRSNDAFQYHLKFPPINPVIHFLRNSIQEQPFEKGLHFLIDFSPDRPK